MHAYRASATPLPHWRDVMARMTMKVAERGATTGARLGRGYHKTLTLLITRTGDDLVLFAREVAMPGHQTQPTKRQRTLFVSTHYPPVATVLSKRIVDPEWNVARGTVNQIGRRKRSGSGKLKQLGYFTCPKLC